MVSRTLLRAGWVAGLALLAVPVIADAAPKNLQPAATATSAAFKGPKVGQKAPDFALKSDNDQTYTLDNLRGRWIVLAFYPKDFTGGCTAEVCSIRDQQANIEALNARVFAISVQDAASHKDFAEKNNLKFRLLADEKQEVTKTYGVLMEDRGLAKRYSFYIDPTGVLRKVDENVQPTSAGKDVLDNLKALQASNPAPSLDEINKQIRPLNRKVATNPGDKDAAADLATLSYLKGHAFMTNTLFPPRAKYPEALKHLNRALTLNPNLVAAQEDKAAIEAIYKG